MNLSVARAFHRTHLVRGKEKKTSTQFPPIQEKKQRREEGVWLGAYIARGGAFVPVRATNRNESSRVGTRGAPRALVPVRSMNRDECPSPAYICTQPHPTLRCSVFFSWIGGKWVLVFFILYHAQNVFDEMPEPHLNSHKMISSTEVSNFILFICN